MEHRVQRIYLDEIGQEAEQSIGVGIVQLVVESKTTTGNLARQLITKARQDLPDATLQQQIIELIETIVLYKFPNLSREEIETMLGLSELKQTRVYQEALEEGLERGELRAKLAMVQKLRQRGFSVEELAELSELDVKTIRQVAAEQRTSPE
jgi:predicted transposase/invertase (TIGR01784 family)